MGLTNSKTDQKKKERKKEKEKKTPGEQIGFGVHDRQLTVQV